MDIINYKNKTYPIFQQEGFSAQYTFPFALKWCKGTGYDIGCMKKEWSLPNSIPIDISFNDGYDAMKLPMNNVDYIFSSHCLEHLENPFKVLEYWYSVLKDDGVLYLYLPDYSQVYWRTWNNTKHITNFNSEMIKDWMIEREFKNIFVGERDLNNSFTIVGEK